ncbi:tetratricopeptide repeat protein, partial [bacterium]|nr:tetratricopeptide repeat protein [bacterium]
LMAAMGSIYVNLGRYSEALDLLTDALRIRQEHLSAVDPQVLESTQTVAMLNRRLNHYATADSLVSIAADAARDALGETDPRTLDLLIGLAWGYAYEAARHNDGSAREAKGVAVVERVLGIRRRELGSDDPVTIETMGILARFYINANREADAEPILVEAIDRAKRVLGIEHRDTLSYLNNLAVVYAHLGRTAEAAPLYRQVLAIRERDLGSTHLRTLGAKRQLAMNLWDMGQHGAAESLMVETLQDYDEVVGPGHMKALFLVVDYAALCRSLGRNVEAESLLVSALEIAQETFVEGHEVVQELVFNLGTLYGAMGRLTDTERVYRASVARFNSGDPAKPAALYNLACQLALGGQNDSALDTLQEAVAEGLIDPEMWIANDPELDSLRGLPEFDAIVAELRRRNEEDAESLSVE